MLHCTDEKMPTGDSNHPAGSTDDVIVPRGNFARKIVGIIKQVALCLMAATLVSACVEAVTAHATNCAEAYCDL